MIRYHTEGTEGKLDHKLHSTQSKVLNHSDRTNRMIS